MISTIGLFSKQATHYDTVYSGDSGVAIGSVVRSVGGWLRNNFNEPKAT